MAEKVQQITVEEMFGIAKKFALQLKQFPMETESAIVEMVRVSMQHRNLQMQRQQQETENDQRAQTNALREKQLTLMRMAAERESAETVPTGLRRGPQPVETDAGADVERSAPQAEEEPVAQ